MKTHSPALSRAVRRATAAPAALASRLLHATGIAVAVSVLSAIALSAWAQSAPPVAPAAPASAPMMHRHGGPMEHHADGSMGPPPGGFMEHRMGRAGRMGGEIGGMMMMHGSPEHMGRMIDMMLDGLNATDSQRMQIKQIAMAAATDLKAQHEAGKAMHQRAMQLFTAPTIDTAAVEKMRQQSLAQHDQASKRVMQAMLDIGKVLTPEQRARVGERMRDRMARMQDRTARMQKMEQDHPRPPR